MMVMSLLKFLADVTPDTPPEIMPSYEGAFLKMFLTLIALIVGIFLTVWLLKRLSQGRLSHSSGKTIQIIEKRSLSPKTMLYLIDVDGKQTLIAESQLEVKKVMDLEPFEKEE